MKVIEATNSTYKKIKEQVDNEINLLKGKEHKNIVKYIGSFEKEIRYEIHFCILMEFVDGFTLRQLIDEVKDKGFKETTIKGFIVQLVEGLDYLLSQNVVHRDLKAENIKVTEKGELKLLDFGVAKEISH